MKPGIYHQTFYHDENCKTLLTRNMADCRCNPKVKIEKSPDMAFTKKKIKDDLTLWKELHAKFN